MKSASIKAGGIDPAPPTRPSSARRLRNLRALVGEFAERDIGCAGVALFLGCSLSAARNYVSELLDAGAIAARPVRQAAGCIDRTLYHLAADPLAVHAFLAAVGCEIREEPPSLSHRGMAPGIWSSAAGAGNGPARRDPLVAALFGPAMLGKADALSQAGAGKLATTAAPG